MTLVEALFGVLAVAAVACALLAVLAREVVHAALWLVVTLGAIAGCYLLMGAEFVALVQVLIYVGAVVVLMLFALMLTRSPTGAGSAEVTANRVLAAVVGACATAGLAATVVAGFAGERIDSGTTEIGSAASLGEALFTEWVLAFEILSVVLLAALVGAIVLSRTTEDR